MLTRRKIFRLARAFLAAMVGVGLASGSAEAVTIGYPNSEVGTQLGSSIFIVQEDTPDMMVNPDGGIFNNFGTALFHDSPNIALGADLTLLVGTQIGFGLAQQAVDLGDANNRFEVVASWSGSRGLVNAPGVPDFVIFEPGSLGGDEAYAVSVRRVDGTFTSYRYQFASDFIPDAVNNFFTRFDLSAFGIPDGAFITAISVVSLIDTDTVDSMSGEGEVTFGGSLGGFAPLSALAPLGTGAAFANDKFDADLAYIGALSAVVVLVQVDIKFLGNPNAFSCKKRGNLPLMIFGTTSLNVTDIDVSSLRLALATNTSMTTASGPVDSSIADRGRPSDAGIAVDGVDVFNQDGIDDLDVSFDAQEVATLIGCSSLNRGDASPTLVLIGQLNDGTPLQSSPVDDVGIDQLVIKSK